MSESCSSSSRRDALRILGGVAVAATIPFGLSTATNAADKPPTLVDSHVHIVRGRVTRQPLTTPTPPPFDLLERPGGAEQLAKLTEKEFESAGVAHALCMPTALVSDDNPLGIQTTLDQAARIGGGVKLHPIGVLHPERFDAGHLEQVEAVLKQGRVKALKAYLGYLHYAPTNPGYRPYYRLAAKYDVPVIFHTGDTYSPQAKVKYAHPLQIDEIAVDFPETKFVLAHFGNPWILDAAQVMYKNENVWADLSAIVIGDAAAFQRMEKEGVLERAVQRIREGIEYAEAPQRFLFASDWPPSPISVYRDFVARLFPPEQHAGVFGENARKLFQL